jgi:hypothetical protein
MKLRVRQHLIFDRKAASDTFIDARCDSLLQLELRHPRVWKAQSSYTRQIRKLLVRSLGALILVGVDIQPGMDGITC